MESTARRRLLRDFKTLKSDPPHGISGAPVKNNIMKWKAIIFGPEGTPWEGGAFQLDMDFSEKYPKYAPDVKFVSYLFHPNVYGDGRICLDILQDRWSPIYDPSAILVSIQSLLSDPNPLSPANLEAAKLYVENRLEYNRRVSKCVENSWSAIDDDEEEEGQDGL